jgi:cyclic pyranopterin phosphate synthase
MELTHIDQDGHLQMVDVSGKPASVRRARARGVIHLRQATLDAITANRMPKGDVFAAARMAGILAAKRCDELIPLCHTVALDSVRIDLRACVEPPRVEIESEVTCRARTGAEMEALLAVSVGALAIYDMVKAVDREAVIGDIRLLEKSGGKSGRFVRKERNCREQ